jgi:hypothetical protein
LEEFGHFEALARWTVGSGVEENEYYVTIPNHIKFSFQREVLAILATL